MWQVFSEYFGFSCQFSFQQMLYSQLARTIGQLVADVPSGLNLTPPHPTKQKESFVVYAVDVTVCYRGYWRPLHEVREHTVDSDSKTLGYVCLRGMGWLLRETKRALLPLCSVLVSHFATCSAPSSISRLSVSKARVPPTRKLVYAHLFHFRNCYTDFVQFY
jgi:hypothetical protein